MSLRPVLSKLLFWSGALSALASLLLPDPLAPRLATLALGAAAGSLLMWRGWKPASHAPIAPPPMALDDSSMLDAMAQIARCCADAGDLGEALRGVGHILTYELGARNVRAALLEPASVGPGHALLRPLPGTTPAPRQAVGVPPSAAADAALREHGIVSDATSGHALAVLDSGRPVALVEFEALELSVAPAALTRLLELMRSELGAVARRSRGDASASSPVRFRTLHAQAAAPGALAMIAQSLDQGFVYDADRRALPSLGLLLDDVPFAAARIPPRTASATERRADRS